jgi:hypothetical protein
LVGTGGINFFSLPVLPVAQNKRLSRYGESFV